MTSKRKSVTFRENVSVVSPNTMDGSSSPDTITHSPTTHDLDPMYLTWLRSATKAQYPFILDGTFAKHIYHQNFNKHRRMKSQWRQQLIHQGELALVPLAEKYGSLGWGSLYRDISPKAWVKNYREIYRFKGTDEQLLSKIAEAYISIKTLIALEFAASNVPNHHPAHTQSESASTLSSYPASTNNYNRTWTAFTQAAGPLTSPDFGLSGVVLPFATNGSMANGDCNGFADKQEGLVQFRPRVREVARDEEVAFGVGVGVGSNDFGAMMDAHGSENWGYAGVGGGEGGVRWGSR